MRVIDRRRWRIDSSSHPTHRPKNMIDHLIGIRTIALSVVSKEARNVRHRVARCGGILSVALALTWLGGCAFAPGMTFRGGCPADVSADPSGACGRATHAASLAATTGGTVTEDAPPTGALVEIDAALIDQTRAKAGPSIPKDVLSLFQQARPYTLGPGDVLSIVVWDHPELNMPVVATSNGIDTTGSNAIVSGYTVDTNGVVQFAYVGPVKVGGLTELQARDLLARHLARYIRDPQVTLRIQAYRSRRIYLDGEVRIPGLQVMNDLPMTLPEAINRAGGFTSNGDRARVAVTRGDATVTVNLPRMIEQGLNPDRILLQSGDLVRVYPLSDSKVFVLGEVGHTMTATFNNGRLTLNDALGYAGGVSPYSGDASQVYVVRSRRGGAPTVFHLNATSPAAMALANDFDLMPDDVVFVDASSLVRWSRVVGMFLPSAQTLATGRNIAF
ncbi:polysaccharide biosynthesis/export family protein [Burkholderia puraquae]